MPGPSPSYRPTLLVDFVEQAHYLTQQRTVAYHLRQRAMLLFLLHANPLLSHVQAAAEVRLHPNAVRYGRRRWAQEVLCLEDQPGRGRKARFSPSGPRSRQSGRV